ncbi:MAG: MOSC domain-containing protein [Rhodomicrobium sp.]
MPAIASLLHYPIKGMGGIELPRVTLKTGEGMPLDRAYAIENGGKRFDAQNPKWLPKANFLQLMQHERLAGLALTFDEASHTLTLFRSAKPVAKGDLQTKPGRQMIEQFLAAYMKANLRGPPRIVSAQGHSFTDIAEKALHLVNLESVRILSRTAGIDLDPLRFRANLYFEGVPAFEERHWCGKTLACGSTTLKVFDETGRCEATSVDPKTARRGLSVPATLERTWGHTKLGLYAKVISGGEVEAGSAIAMLS